MSDASAAETTNWRRVVEPYVGPDARRATFQLVTTLGLLVVALTTATIALHSSVVVAVVPLAILTAGLLVRTFILMHDCAHGSFFASRRLNDAVGFLTGVVTLTPFGQWRRDHALHHASSGDLERRGHGDVPTLTVREYQAKTRRQQFFYRVIRHPALLLLGGPVHLMFGQRFRARSTATGTRQINSVWATNAGIVVLLSVALWTLGWRTVLVVYGLPYYLAAMAGVWLFYVQHQFEDAYWTSHGDWDYATRSVARQLPPRVVGTATLVHRPHRIASRAPPRASHSQLPFAALSR